MHLDFINPRRQSSRIGWYLLVVALAAAIATGYWQQTQVAQRIEAGRSDVQVLQAKLNARTVGTVQMSNKQLSTEWQHAVKVAQALTVPWDSLLAVLEEFSSVDVALLSIETGSVRQDVIVSGEARNYAALVDYYRVLQQQDILHSVVLQTHQVNRQDRDKPVRFRIAAKWGKPQ